jgi:hypothetical protein
MRQFKVTSADLNQTSDNDCYLSPDDPIHQLKAVSQLGGIGSEAALAGYRSQQLPVIQTDERGRIAREQNIQPGTQEWFKHWFGRK